MKVNLVFHIKGPSRSLNSQILQHAEAVNWLGRHSGNANLKVAGAAVEEQEKEGNRERQLKQKQNDLADIGKISVLVFERISSYTGYFQLYSVLTNSI